MLLIRNQPETLAKIMKEAQEDIKPVDNEAQEKFESITQEEPKMMNRVQVAPIQGKTVDKN